jgi:hypothetical protein
MTDLARIVIVTAGRMQCNVASWQILLKKSGQAPEGSFFATDRKNWH